MDKIKLFTIPHAGASTSYFLKWKKLLNSNIELHPLEIAGRGLRYNEPCNDSLIETAEDCFNLIKHLLNRKYAICAHSMGCVIAYELVHFIKERHYPEPQCLFLSGRNAPHFPITKRISDYPDKEFIEEIQTIGGTPNEVFNNKELMEIFVPILKSDYRKIETYSYTQKKEKFNFDIIFFHASSDNYLNRNGVEQWSQLTNNLLEIVPFQGGHFFICDQADEITKIINKKLGRIETCHGTEFS